MNEDPRRRILENRIGTALAHVSTARAAVEGAFDFTENARELMLLRNTLQNLLNVRLNLESLVGTKNL